MVDLWHRRLRFESDAADYSTSLEWGGLTPLWPKPCQGTPLQGGAIIPQDLAEVMPMKTLFAAILSLGLFCCSQLPAIAQDQAAQPAPAQQPSAEELEKQKAEMEKNAYRLLEQVIDEAQALKLTENRVRVQISAADMLWDQNQGRARGLFAMAAEGVAELGRTSTNTNRRGGPQTSADFFGNGVVGPPNARAFQLRQELVLAAARHDAALAYQLLAAT